MKVKYALWILVAAVLGGIGWLLHNKLSRPPGESSEFAGSVSCKGCHDSFYEKWSTSWHGLAMQPYTADFARKNLAPQGEAIEFRGRTYQFEMDGEKGFVREKGPEGETAHPIEQVMGGKNVYYFLTPRQGGRLQVLPVAFDSRNREWYNTTGSMVRHLVSDVRDEALDWTERPLTFNASCFSCHVSQLKKNYDLETDSYRTTWEEPGINCESCHGPGREHIQAVEDGGDRVPEDLKILITTKFKTAQLNSMCGSCHAKMVPLTAAFEPGERFFDHYNLVLLEDQDFYPDGRDLGENFTYTLWRIGACAGSGKLSCMHCHTSSGRNRHTGENEDQACLPCHEDLVKNAAGHSHHEEGSPGSRCVSCHMPRTVFARMERHDHSLLPPAPAATRQFKSPNACNICHQDHDEQWADEWVRKWYPRDYQAPLLYRASLIDAARKGDWSKLLEMAAYITGEDRNEVFAASLLRLLDPCPDPAKWPAFLKALRDPSPLVRSSAAQGLSSNTTPVALKDLVEAAGDSFRIVRNRAAAALARIPLELFEEGDRNRILKALSEYEDSLRCLPDDPTRHYNLGNYYQDRGELEKAISAYEIANRLQPSLIQSLVNLSMVHARREEPGKAEEALRKALEIQPKSAEANFNLALLLAERNQKREAEDCFRKALEANPKFAQAAYNLGVLLSNDRPQEGLELCRKAAQLSPGEPKYAYTHAFYLHQQGELDEATRVLEKLIEEHAGFTNPSVLDGWILLGAIYERSGQEDQALDLYRRAAAGILPEKVRQFFASKIALLEGR